MAASPKRTGQLNDVMTALRIAPPDRWNEPTSAEYEDVDRGDELDDMTPTQAARALEAARDEISRTGDDDEEPKTRVRRKRRTVKS